MLMIEDEIRTAVKNAAAEADLPVGGNDIKLEHPAALEHGDFATNLALSSRKNPQAAHGDRDGVANNISSPLHRESRSRRAGIHEYLALRRLS